MIPLSFAAAVTASLFAAQSDATVFSPALCPFNAGFPAPYISSRLQDGGAMASHSGAEGRRLALCAAEFRRPDASPCQDVRRLSRSVEASRPGARARWLIVGPDQCVREVTAAEDDTAWRYVIAASAGSVFMVEERLVAGAPVIEFEARKSEQSTN